MDPETQRQFQDLDQRLRQAAKQILATGNLVGKAGIPFLVNTQIRLDALEESHARLYGALQHLTEQVSGLAEAQKETSEAQKKTDQTVNRLAATVQAFIDSMTRGGNGSKS